MSGSRIVLAENVEVTLIDRGLCTFCFSVATWERKKKAWLHFDPKLNVQDDGLQTLSSTYRKSGAYKITK